MKTGLRIAAALAFVLWTSAGATTNATGADECVRGGRADAGCPLSTIAATRGMVEIRFDTEESEALPKTLANASRKTLDRTTRVAIPSRRQALDLSADQWCNANRR